MDRKHVVLVGPPGAGKGTQARRLSEDLGVPHISAGEMFRHEIEEQTDVGRIAEEYAERGELAPDELTVSMMRRRLSQPDVCAGFVLDGFPRNLVQARALDEILEASDMHLGCLLHLTVPDAEIHRRLNRRARTEGRTDDADQAVIRKRIETYRRQTKPVLAYYERRDLVRQINGTGSEDDVFERITCALGLARS
jgi:adenylate kinase